MGLGLVMTAGNTLWNYLSQPAGAGAGVSAHSFYLVFSGSGANRMDVCQSLGHGCDP